MEKETHIQNLLLRRYHNPHQNEDCRCNNGKRLVRCHWDGCFQYATSCEAQCFVASHRCNPFHWALVWDLEKGVWTKHDFSELCGGTSIQLGHLEDQAHCSGSGRPQPFVVTHTNGIHNTQLTFCGCPTNPATEKVDQLLLSAATMKDPKSAFTMAVLKQFRMHNLQSKCGAFDYVMSLRRFTNGTFTSKVSVSQI